MLAQSTGDTCILRFYSVPSEFDVDLIQLYTVVSINVVRQNIVIVIITTMIIMRFSPVLFFFLGLLSHVSATSCSLETQHFMQDVSSTKDG